jgi:ribokinase
MNKIVVIGSVNTDMVVKGKKLPLPGETLIGGVFFMNAGGKGANQAVAAARLGGNVALVSKVGNDFFGRDAIERFRGENIGTDYIFVDAHSATGTALIMVNEEGENCIVVAPGANQELVPSDIENIGAIQEAEIVLMQLEIPIETIAFVAQKLKGSSAKIIINPAPACPLSDELLDGLFLITPNETEASFLTGIKVSDYKSAAAAAKRLLDKGVRNVIITLGKQGAYFRNSELELSVAAPIVDVLDTTAAGDTFNGALAVAITAKMDWEQAMQFAVKAASISVTRLGAQNSIPYRNELDG